MPDADAGSPPPATVAVLLADGTAALPTLTLSVTVLEVAPAAIAVVLVQLITLEPTRLLPTPP